MHCEFQTKVWPHSFTHTSMDIWDIVALAAPYNPATGYCDLCTEEKYRIMFEPEGASLNQKS